VKAGITNTRRLTPVNASLFAGNFKEYLPAQTIGALDKAG
jgi:hypothetical protein